MTVLCSEQERPFFVALAALWENWRSPAGEWVRSFAIITTTPNELCAELHNRMPVVLEHRVWPEWLGEEPADRPRLKALLIAKWSIRLTSCGAEREQGQNMEGS